MPATTRRMKKNLEKVALQESIPPTKTIIDVPPEVFEMILKHLDSSDNSMLPYRLVHPEWTNIINGFLEKRALKGELVACPKKFIEGNGIWNCNPNPTIRVAQTIIEHPGNPFPSRSLSISQYRDDRGGRNDAGGDPNISLNIFMTKFGSHLNTFVLDRVNIKFTVLIAVLGQLPNLKILKLSKTFVGFNCEDDPQSFPPLPHLKTMELMHYTSFLDISSDRDEDKSVQFFLKLIYSNAHNLESLKLKLCRTSIPLQQQLPLVENCTSQSIEQLEICNPTADFLRLSCIRPVKRLLIVGLDYDVSIDVLMSFIDKFRNTLESLDLDFPWEKTFASSCEQKAMQTRRIFQTAAVNFPKLTKFTVAYPTNKASATVVKNIFLVKFPILKELCYFHFQQAHNIPPETATTFYQMEIKKFTDQENYWRVFTTLNHISVWFTGERSDFDGTWHTQNYHIHSVFRGESIQKELLSDTRRQIWF